MPRAEVAFVRAGLFDITKAEVLGTVTSFNGDTYTIEVKVTDAVTLELEVAYDKVEIPYDDSYPGSLSSGDEVMVVFRG